MCDDIYKVKLQLLLHLDMFSFKYYYYYTTSVLKMCVKNTANCRDDFNFKWYTILHATEVTVQCNKDSVSVLSIDCFR
jgi:hypothetical protein